MARKTFLWMLVLWTTACDEPEFLSKKENGSEKPYTLSILSQQTCPLPEGLDPKKVTILSYRVKLEGHSPLGTPANYFYASLLTDGGERYLAEYAGCQPVLSGAPLLPGQSATGYLNFPVPPSKAAKTLEFSPDILNLKRDESLVQLQMGESEIKSEAEVDGQDRNAE